MNKVRSAIASGCVLALMSGGILVHVGCGGGAGTEAVKAPGGAESDEMKAQRAANEANAKGQAAQHKR